MSMLHPSELARRPPLAPFAPASVSLGEGRSEVIPNSAVASAGTVVYLSALVQQLYRGIEYLSRNTVDPIPEHFTFVEKPAIPVKLKITAVERSEFFFDDQD